MKKQPSQQSDFMVEKIKGRPISKRKLVKKTITTVVMALLFGIVACLTFLLLQPRLQGLIHKEEETIPPQVVSFPEDPVEMEPEEMLSEKQEEESKEESQTPTILEEEQIQEILSEVTLDIHNYSQIYQALSEYTASLKKSMVTISGIGSSTDWLNNVNEQTVLTSGTVIYNNNKELLIVTYYDKIKDAQTVYAKFYGSIVAQAQLKGYDTDTGLAVLTVPLTSLGTEYWEENITIAQMGSSNVRNLESTPVVAVGMPMGTEGSVGYGIITSTAGKESYTDANYKLIQTDILGTASAGGMIFNMKGEIVGMITDHKPKQMENVLMAFGISDLKKLLSKLSNGEPKAYLGLKGTLVSMEANQRFGMPYGAYIQEVEMDSPAMKAGLLKGDVITQMNDRQILSFSDYTSVLFELNPEDEVNMAVYRLVQDEYKIMSVEMKADEVYQGL